MKQVLILCGGQSAEHEVSIMSARNVLDALDTTQFQPVIVVVSRSGTWYWFDKKTFESLVECDDATTAADLCTLMRKPLETVLLSASGESIKIDVAFGLIHGPMGEDGTLQGLFEMMCLPYVGSGVLSSAMGMDKDVLKKAFVQAGLPVTPSITLTKHSDVPEYDALCQKLGSQTLFVKPSVMGSSVGVIKVHSEAQYKQAIQNAFCYGFKVIIERNIVGREIECAVLGNFQPIASGLGEISSHHEFYSYEAKYLDPKGATLTIPAKLPDHLVDKLRDYAIKAFVAAECMGMARVDFFLQDDESIYINELNTIPGFTNISMYPKLWEASKISYTQLVSKLLSLAFELFAAKQSIHLRPALSHQFGAPPSKEGISQVR